MKCNALPAFYIVEGVIMMDQWIAIIQEVTFPIFISFYLLYRIETKLEAIHTALVSLSNPVERH